MQKDKNRGRSKMIITYFDKKIMNTNNKGNTDGSNGKSEENE